MNKALVVGIDTGKTLGISIMDFDGKILFLKTFRNVKKSEIIATIKKHGNPLIIASDVNPFPSSLKKIARQLGAKIFEPKKSLTLKQKKKLTKNFSKIIKNKHERDAIAACIKAIGKYNEILKKIKSKLKGKELMIDSVIERIILKKVENIEEAIKKAI